ncbi:MAG TPA: tetratricopeptide repeat protein [Bacteroidota bacterium]|nr:tetratricopeptide repeat protein [Bacteroidota bacterium]
MPSRDFSARIFNKPYLPYVLIVLVAILVYGQTVTFQFTNLDDQKIILDNFPTLSNLSNVSVAFTTDAFVQLGGSMFYRPMQTLSFMFDAAIGGRDAGVYHAVNVLLHAATCCLLLAFLLRLKYAPGLSFFLALLYAVHPLFTHAVAWVPSRGDLLIACFALAAFLTGMQYLDSGKPITLLLHLLFFAIAVYSKETALVIPFVFVVFVLITKTNVTVQRGGLVCLVWVTCIASYLILRFMYLSGAVPSEQVGLRPLMLNLPVLFLFVAKLFLPFGLSTMPLISPLFAWIGVAISVLLLAMVFRTKNIRRGLALFGVFWFASFVGPSLLYRHPLADVAFQFFEHRAYLPCIGLMILLAELLTGYPGFVRKAGIRLGSAVLILFAGITMIHARVYHDPMAFVGSALEANPTNAVAYYNRASVEFFNGELQGAMTDVSRAIAIRPNFAGAYYSRALIYGQLGAYQSALSDYDNAIHYDSTDAMSYFNRSIVEWILKDYAKAMRDCNASIRILPELWVWYYHRGNLETDLGETQTALHDFDTALVCIASRAGYNDARYSSVLNNSATYADLYVARAKALRILGRAAEAVRDCDKALAQNPNNADAYSCRGLARLALSDTGNARGDFDMAIRFNPQSGLAYFGRGNVKFAEKDNKGACNDWKRAKAFGYAEADSVIALNCVN